MTTTTTITHFVNGKPWTGPPAARQGRVFDPATGAVAGQVDLASASDVDTVVTAAAAAAPGWADTSLSRRSAVLFAFRELLHGRRDELAAAVTAEHGKTLPDAAGEVQRGLEVVEYACGIPSLLRGAHSENVSTGVDSYSVRQPVGVAAVISPFNFPVMVPLWFIPVAVAAIFTNDGGAARRFSGEVTAGMVGVNVPIPVPMAYYSFGGWKSSLFGDLHAHGTDGVQFYTRGKVVTTRWPDPSHGGVSLGFPTQQ